MSATCVGGTGRNYFFVRGTQGMEASGCKGKSCSSSYMFRGWEMLQREVRSLWLEPHGHWSPQGRSAEGWIATAAM